jgi:hypothetical protein
MSSSCNFTFCFYDKQTTNINNCQPLFEFNITPIQLKNINKIINSNALKEVQTDKLIVECDDKSLMYIYIDLHYIYMVITNNKSKYKNNYVKFCGSATNPTCFFQELSEFITENSTNSTNRTTADNWHQHKLWFNNLYNKYAMTTDLMQNVKNQVEQVTEQMSKNIDLMTERGLKVDVLDVKTAELKSKADNFTDSSNKLKNRIKYQYWKKIFFIGCIVVIIICLALLAFFL